MTPVNVPYPLGCSFFIPEQIIFGIIVSTIYGRKINLRESDITCKLLRDNIQLIIEGHGTYGIAYTLRLANHAKFYMGVNTIPIIIITELSKLIQEQKLTFPGFKDHVAKLIVDSTDIIDTYLYSIEIFKDKKLIPLSIKRGIAQSFNKFTEVEFKLCDLKLLKLIIKLVHPEPKDDETSSLFKKIINGELETH